MAPPMTPPTASILPAPLFDEAEVVALVVVAVPVEDVAAAEDVLDTKAWTSEGMRVPQVTQASEPGLAMRHWAKVASQMKLGRVPWYWAMFEGPVPLAQVHWKVREDWNGISCQLKWLGRVGIGQWVRFVELGKRDEW